MRFPSLRQTLPPLLLALLLLSACSAPSQHPIRWESYLRSHCRPTAALHWLQPSTILTAGDPLNLTTLNAEVDGGMLGIKCFY